MATATVSLMRSSKPMTKTGHYCWWPTLDGRSYDFNGRPWWNDGGDARELTADELETAFDMARKMELRAEDMYWGTLRDVLGDLDSLEEAQALRDDLRLNAPAGC